MTARRMLSCLIRQRGVRITAGESAGPLGRPRAQYVAGGTVTVTEDPRLSLTVTLHEFLVPHGSGTLAVACRPPVAARDGR